MSEMPTLAERFERSRRRLRAVAYRMLGSLSEADDALQEAWLRLQRADASTIDNLEGWLTTVVAHLCLDLLRTRAARGEELRGVRLPEPVVGDETAPDPEQEALLAGAVGLALQVVLDALPPAERLALVLHDMFGMPFEAIAPIVGRSPVAARQLASRARRRVRGAAPPPAHPERQRALVDAFLAASRGGDLPALLALLDPEVVLRVELGPPAGTRELRGARAAAEEAIRGARLPAQVRPVRVNGTAGLVGLDGRGRALSVLAFSTRGGRIVRVDVLADPARLAGLALPAAS